MDWLGASQVKIVYMHGNSEGVRRMDGQMKVSAAGFGALPADKARSLDGLGLMTGIMEGRLPAPPIAKALGFWMAEVERGRVVFAYKPVVDHYNPLGSVHGGIAATLLDSVLGCAIHTTLQSGSGFTTLELKINYVRAMSEKTSRVPAEGQI